MDYQIKCQQEHQRCLKSMKITVLINLSNYCSERSWRNNESYSITKFWKPATMNRNELSLNWYICPWIHFFRFSERLWFRLRNCNLSNMQSKTNPKTLSIKLDSLYACQSMLLPSVRGESETVFPTAPSRTTAFPITLIKLIFKISPDRTT